jgi:hypothetical protein
VTTGGKRTSEDGAKVADSSASASAVENSTHTRARGSKEQAKAAPPKAERVKHFRQMMAEGTYLTGYTVVEYAEKWGLAEQTLRLDTAEAARSFEESDEDKASAKARWLASVHSAMQNARMLGRCEAEARFLELQAKAQGFLEPQKVELSGSLGDLLSLATGSGGEDSDPKVGE